MAEPAETCANDQRAQQPTSHLQLVLFPNLMDKSSSASQVEL